MDLNQQIKKAISDFFAEKSSLVSSMSQLVSTSHVYNEYDGSSSISEIASGIDTFGMTPELIQARNELIQQAKAFDAQIASVNEDRIIKNVEISKKIQKLVDAFYAKAKDLYAQMPKPVLRENASVTFPVKRLDEKSEKALIESFNTLGLRFEKKGNCYHGYYFSSKKNPSEKNEKVNFQKYENITKKLSLLLEINTDGELPNAFRFMTNNFSSDSIYGYETPEQEKLTDIISRGPQDLYVQFTPEDDE